MRQSFAPSLGESMSEWRPVTLGSVTSNYDAKRRPVKTTQRIAGPYPYYGASGIIDYVEDFVLDGDYLLIAEDGENLRTRSTPVAFLASGKLWVNNHAHVVTGNHLADTRFLSHLLSITDVSGYLTGSTQPKLTRSAMDSIALQVPSIETQRAIAEVLGALDDKIAANTKLARLSLEISSAIFQSHVRVIARSASTFLDLAKISGGGTPSTKVPEFWDGDINWATPSDVTALAGPYLRSTSRRISDEGLQACSSSLFQTGAILMTSRATIGAFAMAQTATAVNQGFIVVEPIHEYMRYWLFHEMHSRVDEFLSLANGATFLELSRGNFKKLPVRLAEPEVLNSFAEVAGSLHSSAAAAHRENETLAETRDALLPQLMSGKLRVRDAETAVEAVV